MLNHKGLLKRFSPCHEAFDWYDGKDSEEAWQECKHGDWMLWVAAKLNVDHRLIVLAACDCAEMTLHHVPKDETRPAEAIATARKWCDGKASIEEAQKAADAAGAAATAYAAYAAYAADAAASAAAGCGMAAATAADAADAYAAANTANTASADKAREESLARSAEIVRQRISWSIVEEAIAKFSQQGANDVE